MNKSYKVAIYGTLAALIVVCLYLETLITAYWLVPPAIFSLSLVMAFALTKDWKNAIISGLIFGMTSFLLAWVVFPQFSAVFGNPLISVLPRVLATTIAYFAYALTNLLLRNSKKNKFTTALPYSIGAGVGVLCNTILVVLAMSLLVPDYTFSFATILSINFLFEFVGSILICPAIMFAMKRIGLGEKKNVEPIVEQSNTNDEGNNDDFGN